MEKTIGVSSLASLINIPTRKFTLYTVAAGFYTSDDLSRSKQHQITLNSSVATKISWQQKITEMILFLRVQLNKALSCHTSLLIHMLNSLSEIIPHLVEANRPEAMLMRTGRIIHGQCLLEVQKTWERISHRAAIQWGNGLSFAAMQKTSAVSLTICEIIKFLYSNSVISVTFCVHLYHGFLGFLWMFVMMNVMMNAYICCQEVLGMGDCSTMRMVCWWASAVKTVTEIDIISQDQGRVRCVWQSIIHFQLCLLLPGGAKKRPEVCVTITARVLYLEKFPLAHL